MPFQRCGDVTLHYEEQGSGPETILFVHGYSGSWERWRALWEHLHPGVRAIAPDLRGAGQSDKPVTGYMLRDFVGDLVAFAGALGLRDFTLVGHSMGGTIAYQFALDHPGLLKAAVYVTPASADGIEPPQESLFEEQAHKKADRAYALAEYGKTRFYRPVPEWVAEQSARALEMSADQYLREAWWAMTNARLGPRLAEITTPSLMIGADRDDAVSLESVLADHHRIPNCGLYVLSRCNHWPPLEAPRELAEVLLDFIAGVNARGKG